MEFWHKYSHGLINTWRKTWMLIWTNRSPYTVLSLHLGKPTSFELTFKNKLLIFNVRESIFLMDLNKIWFFSLQFKGFFRGLSWPLFSFGVVNSVYFGVYGNTLKYLEKDRSTRKSSYLSIYIAGCVGGAAQLIPVIPVDYVKVALQAQIAHGKDGSGTDIYHVRRTFTCKLLDRYPNLERCSNV